MLLLTSLLAVTVPYSCSALVPSFPSRTKSAAARLSYVTFLPHSGRGTPICRVSDGFFPLFSTPEENDGAAALGESRDMLKKELDVEPPPKSFFQLQQQAYRATKLAMEDGVKLMEVEFPPLPAQTLEADDVSAYDVASANVRLAIDFAMPFTEVRVMMMTSSVARSHRRKFSHDNIRDGVHTLYDTDITSLGRWKTFSDSCCSLP
uniref:DUF1995 domain-containing protein n=1 Tax=Corethron hystrix TaxID=216773 RepID=A0A6U5E033_9STRA|mmetsp:Transcript_14959/g.33331  ORF Transcript_14959/g.33331 Transcript_14959/m.33331 type:complete len:206 (+) Transcript_14959:152-769(+)